MKSTKLVKRDPKSGEEKEWGWIAATIATTTTTTPTTMMLTTADRRWRGWSSSIATRPAAAVATANH